MPIRINNISAGLDDSLDDVKRKALKKLNLSEGNVIDFHILRESLDARKKDNIKFNYTVEVICDKEEKLVNRLNDKDVIFDNVKYEIDLTSKIREMKNRPIVIGTGPAGIFAGLLLAKRGLNPIIIERGEAVDERTATVARFWKTGELNPESNVQFGEGGAGTFSDGKLNTRIKDSRCSFVLEEFVKAGAPGEIIYSGKPHIGTDKLKIVVKNIRKKIEQLGGEVRFNSKFEGIVTKNNALKAIVVNSEEIPCDTLIVAIGHSSRDTYEMLLKCGVMMEPKAFAIGVRIEHKQSMIDERQYGKLAIHPKLRAADYRLTFNSPTNNRSVYSFCMCPGGEVVASASEPGRLVTNGMSYYSRSNDNANAGILVTVTPEDFGSSSPLSGMEFQRHYEEKAFLLGGANYSAPIQLVGDFMRDRVSTKLGTIAPTYTPGYEFRDLRQCLPEYVTNTLKEGLANFDQKIKGFGADDAVMTGIETRTSAPVKIIRSEKLQSISVKGIYPAGEGAGFAGGIISAAVDGLKTAEAAMAIDWEIKG